MPGTNGAFTDPSNRHPDYTIVNGNRSQTIRTNGTFELPMGPNKLMFGNSSGFVARMIEHWQLGVIYNYNTGSYANVGPPSNHAVWKWHAGCRPIGVYRCGS